MKNNCCSGSSFMKKEYELLKIEKTDSSCALCENFAEAQLKNKVPYSVISCEGACLRGEVSRRVANNICFSEIPEKSSRICLGGAFTKNTGQRKLVGESWKVICLEGCHINCASRMMKAAIPDLKPEVMHVNKYYEFDTDLFGINEANEEELKNFAREATRKIVDEIIAKEQTFNDICCS